MSFESTDDRIERLEIKYTALIKSVVKCFTAQQAWNKGTDKALVLLTEHLISHLRSIVSNSTIIDGSTKQQLLDQLPAFEKLCAEMKVLVAQMDEPIANISLLLPPLDDSSP